MVPIPDAKVNPGQSPKRPVPRLQSGHIMIEDAQEERFSDVVAIAYFALALLLMILWAYVPA